MGNVTSTLDIVLKDDVTKNAAQIDAALKRMASEAKAVDSALAKGGASDKLAAGLKRIGASVPAIEGATRAMREYAAAEGLAAERGQWTKEQAAGFRAQENVMLSRVRAMMAADKALEEQRARSSAHYQQQIEKQAAAARRLQEQHSGHFDQSTLGGTMAAAGAFAFEQMAERAIERYRDFDKERRYAKVVMGLTDEQQEPLVQQALRGGATSRFNDIQWLEAQREFAARGYKLDQVRAFTPIAADVGSAFDQTLPEAVKAIEGAMLGFGKDVSTYEKAVAAARRTADLEVKASKISGMSFEDITQLYKYGAAPAKMAGLSEEQMLAFGAVLKKNNMGGDESGVAFRALAKNLVSPTAGAITAMRANGIDFSSYQHARAMDVAGFTSMVAQRYGVQLSAAAQAGIARIFTDKGIVGDASKFTPAVVQFLQGALGGKDAKSLKSIAGLAKEYRTASVDGVDTVRLLTDMMTAMSKNKGLANALFGSKQGGRIFAALSDPEVFNGLLDQIRDHSAGYAGDVAAARNEGFNGAMSQLEGAIATLESSIGRAFDNGGKGGFLTEAAAAAARFVAAVSEFNPATLRAGVEAAAAVAVVAGLKGLDFIKSGFGLKAAGAEMTSAGEMQLQAGRLMLEAAGGRVLPHGPGGEPGGKTGEPGLKPGEVSGAKPGELPTFLKDAPKSFLGGGGIKGLAGGLAEGVIGALIYGAGQDAIHAGEDRFLGWTPKDHEHVDSIDPWKDNWFGSVGDKTGPADPYLGGGRAAIDEKAKRAADAFRRDPEAERADRMAKVFGPSPAYDGPYEPVPGIERRTIGAYIRGARPEAAAGTMPAPIPPPASIPDAPTIAPKVDSSGVENLKTQAVETHAALDGLNTNVAPQVSAASLQAYLALLREAVSLQGQLGHIGGGVAGATPASFNPRRSFSPASHGDRFSA